MLAVRYLLGLIICGLLLLSATSICAQDVPAPLPSPSPESRPEVVGQDDTVRIETDLVDLNVTVLSRDAKNVVGQLGQKDFTVFEDGVAQEISFFASSETPFDLVLLIDLSGSTSDKLKLIRKSATSFIEAARPTDRIAIITFTDILEVVSPLTLDRQDLRVRVKQMRKPRGGTNFWDALRYVLETMLNPERTARRSAVVLMTDGVDNALPDVPGEGSHTSFEELTGIVNRSDSIVIPIYLDTERETIENHLYSAVPYKIARTQLALLATESGSTLYYARKVEDLKNVYQQVIRDLNTIYSIGYRPLNKTRDGSWRSVQVKLNERPDLTARTRRGYFAK